MIGMNKTLLPPQLANRGDGQAAVKTACSGFCVGKSDRRVSQPVFDFASGIAYNKFI